MKAPLSLVASLVAVSVIAIVIVCISTTSMKMKTAEGFAQDPSTLVVPAPVQVKLQDSNANNEIDSRPDIIQKPFTTGIYSTNSVERCDALFGSIEARGKMSVKALEAMDNFVLGFRVREWKPKLENSTLVATSGSNSSFCYMYYDSNNGIIDPLLQNKTCDMTNPLFQKDVIKRVFKDAGDDKSHTLPYQKCVMEVDLEKANQIDSLNDFWKDVGEAQCQTIYTRYSGILTNVKTVYTQCNEEFTIYDKLYPQYVSQSNLLFQNKDTITALSNQIVTSNCGFFGLHEGDHPYTSKCDPSISGSYYDSMERIQSLTSLQSSLATSNENLANANTAFIKKNQQYNRLILEFTEQSKAASNDLRTCSNNSVPDMTNALNMQIQDTSNLTKNISAISKQVNDCLNGSNQLRPILDKITKSNNTIDAAINSMRLSLISCTATRDYYKELVAGLKSEVAKTSAALEACNSERQAVRAQRDQLQMVNTQLVQERDDWLRRCKADQESIYTGTLQEITKFSNEALKNAKATCGNPAMDMKEIEGLIKLKEDARQKIVEQQQAAASVNVGTCLTEGGRIQRDCCGIPDPQWSPPPPPPPPAPPKPRSTSSRYSRLRVM